jgi:hypothetical protein
LRSTRWRTEINSPDVSYAVWKGWFMGPPVVDLKTAPNQRGCQNVNLTEFKMVRLAAIFKGCSGICPAYRAILHGFHARMFG